MSDYTGSSPFRPRRTGRLLQRTFPVSEHLPACTQRNLGSDALAGVTVASLALPSAMAYAQLAGLSPVAVRAVEACQPNAD
ncbi:MAG TPA: SulP family inorganic anion transporter [Acidimicrobiales bacterium]|nr:SulP family inorganic anion transporter [Acidimicrobiales bacterium]